VVVVGPPVIESWRGGSQPVVCATVSIRRSTAGINIVYM
jgi:hypothetical protein